MKKLFPIFLSLCWVSVADTLVAQTLLNKSVISNGGAPTFSGTQKMIITLGQPITNIQQSNSQKAQLGFWYRPIVITPLPSPFKFLKQSLSIKIFPNPSTTITIIEYNKPKDTPGFLKITDLHGRLVKIIDISGERFGQTYSLDTSKMGAGMYTVNLSTGTEQLSQKLIVL